MGTFLQYKPFTFKNQAGEADGWDTDIAKALAEDMGVKPEFVDNSWDGIIPALQADKFDAIIAAMTNTKKRSLAIQFTYPYYMAANAFIFRSADAGRFPTLDKFNTPGLKVSVLIQDAAHIALARFFPKAQVVDYNSAEEAILAVQTKKADCSIAEYSFLGQYAKEHPGLTVKAVDYPGAGSPLAMGLVAGPENEHLKTFLNVWIQHFFWSGQHEPISRSGSRARRCRRSRSSSPRCNAGSRASRPGGPRPAVDRPGPGREVRTTTGHEEDVSSARESPGPRSGAR